MDRAKQRRPLVVLAPSLAALTLLAAALWLDRVSEPTLVKERVVEEAVLREAS